MNLLDSILNILKKIYLLIKNFNFLSICFIIFIYNFLCKIILFFNSFLFIIFFSIIFRFFFYEIFYVPSSSMFPNLNIGDFILVKKYTLNILNNLIKKNFFNSNNDIKRGDILAFKFPLNKKIIFAKRVIGLPEDIITYNILNKKISIITKNKSILKYNKKFYLRYNKFLDIYNNKKKFIFDRVETINNDVFYYVFINNLEYDKIIFLNKSTNLIKWKIKKNNYFVVGDNRNNSFDSRYWGTVNKKYILGKITFIIFNFDINNIKYKIKSYLLNKFT